MFKLKNLLPAVAFLAFSLPVSDAMAEQSQPNIIRIPAPVSLGSKTPEPSTPVSYALTGTLRADGISFQSAAAPSIVLQKASSEEGHASFTLSSNMPIIFEKLAGFDRSGTGADYFTTIGQQGCSGSGGRYQCVLDVVVKELAGVGCEDILTGCGVGSVGEIDFEGTVQKNP